MTEIQLPIPDTSQLDHSNNLVQIIKEYIQSQNSWISFAEYMNLALYHPLYGYYTGGKNKLGQSGDFITAPTLDKENSLFAYALAKQIYPILLEQTHFSILEFGAGNGDLVVNLLKELNTIAKQNNQNLDNLLKNYFILDLSAELVDRQKSNVKNNLPKELKSKIQWLDTLPEDNSFDGIIIANEVVDAMPVNLFSLNNNTIQEIGVSFNNNKFIYKSNEPDTIISNYIEQNISEIIQSQNIYNNHFNYTSEINLLALDWLSSVAQCMNTGLILLIDYGFPRAEYYHIDRHMGTLMCHYRHHSHPDPFLYPGLQDITAHVDFTSLAETAQNNDLDIIDFVSQAHFLLANNVTEYFNQLKTSDNKHIFKLNQQLKKLTSPSEMGELFKVLLLGKNLDYKYFSDLEVYSRLNRL